MPAIRLPASPVGSVSLVVGDLRHTWGCALPTMGGVCDCGAARYVLRIDYGQLAALLAEGWYPEPDPYPIITKRKETG